MVGRRQSITTFKRTRTPPIAYCRRRDVNASCSSSSSGGGGSGGCGDILIATRSSHLSTSLQLLGQALTNVYA